MHKVADLIRIQDIQTQNCWWCFCCLYLLLTVNSKEQNNRKFSIILNVHDLRTVILRIKTFFSMYFIDPFIYFQAVTIDSNLSTIIYHYLYLFLIFSCLFLFFPLQKIFQVVYFKCNCFFPFFTFVRLKRWVNRAMTIS